MIRRWPARLLGVTVGVLAAVLIAAVRPGTPIAQPTGAVLSECDGAIGQVAIQYVAGMDFVWPTYRALLAALPADVGVTLVCPAAHDRDELLAAVGQPAGRFSFVLTGHPMTIWSRDRWLTLSPESTRRAVTLIAPLAEAGADAWPQRRGDSDLAFDLASALRGYETRRSRLIFDGGDFLVDGSTAFVSPAVVERNLSHTVQTESELIDQLHELLGKKIDLLRNAPPHHVGMYMAIAGNGVAVVGDPSLGQPLLADASGPADANITPDTTENTQKQFDEVAAQMLAAGYRVVRIPTIVAPDGKTYLTYVNGLIDQRNGRRTFFLPTYRGQTALNAAAARVWENLGYAVVPIDCTEVFPHFGTLHCLVNVLKRS